jgi:hypothetical protein
VEDIEENDQDYHTIPYSYFTMAMYIYRLLGDFSHVVGIVILLHRLIKRRDAHGQFCMRNYIPLVSDSL